MKRRKFFRNSVLGGAAAVVGGSLLAGQDANAATPEKKLPEMPPKNFKPDDTGLQKIIHRADTRGGAEYGWLKANFSFSFGGWQNKERQGFGALRVMNDDFIQPSGGFPMHPHDNFEIVTVPLSGVIEHKDSLGNGGQISANEVQIMSAGSGIRHSEYNASDKDLLNVIQVWVQPKKQNITPRYEQRKFKPEDRRNQFKTVVSPEDNDGAVWINQDAWFTLGNFSSGRKEKYSIKRSLNGVYMFVIGGKIRVAGEILDKRDAIGIYNTNWFEIEMLEDAELLLLDVPISKG